MRSVQISRQLLPPLQTFFIYGFSIGFIDVWSLPNNHPAAPPPPAGTQLAIPCRLCVLSRQMIARSGPTLR